MAKKDGTIWRCWSCGRINEEPERVSFCGSCFSGRSKAIEDDLADKVGLPHHVTVRVQRMVR